MQFSRQNAGFVYKPKWRNFCFTNLRMLYRVAKLVEKDPPTKTQSHNTLALHEKHTFGSQEQIIVRQVVVSNENKHRPAKNKNSQLSKNHTVTSNSAITLYSQDLRWNCIKCTLGARTVKVSFSKGGWRHLSKPFVGGITSLAFAGF